MKPALAGLSFEAINAILARYNQPLYRARQVAEWLYKHNATSIHQMTNLPVHLRARLDDEYEVGLSPPLHVQESRDGTRKYLFATRSGHHIETAVIPDRERRTLCLSSQVGCKRACRFCATGRQRLIAQLEPADILNQFLSCPERDLITNIVFMGMGEPLDNYEAVKTALTLFTADYALARSPTRLTLSTVGIIPTLRAYLTDFTSHLALSLHSPFPEQRLQLMPVEQRYPMRDVLRLLREHPFQGQRRLTIEYMMIDDVNDGIDQARALIDLLRPLACRVNLIPCNVFPALAMNPSPRHTMETFQNHLKRAGLVTTLRQSKGADIAAACGLLSTQAS